MNQAQVFFSTCGKGVVNGWTICSNGVKAGCYTGFEQAVKWKGMAVVSLKDLSTRAPISPRVASIGATITANLIFFGAINHLCRRLNNKLENDTHPIIKTEYKLLKHLIVNVILPGTFMIGANKLLSLAIPMSGSVIVGIAVGTVAARLLINCYSPLEHRSKTKISEDDANQQLFRNQQAQIQQLQTNVNTLNQEKGTIQSALNTANADLNTANADKVNLAQQVTRLQNDKQDLQNRVNTLVSEKATFEQTIRRLNEENAKFKSEPQSIIPTEPPLSPQKIGAAITGAFDGLTNFVNQAIDNN